MGADGAAVFQTESSLVKRLIGLHSRRRSRSPRSDGTGPPKRQIILAVLVAPVSLSYAAGFSSLAEHSRRQSDR